MSKQIFLIVKQHLYGLGGRIIMNMFPLRFAFPQEAAAATATAHT